MAKKKRRKRRTPEEIIEDLERQRDELKAKVARKNLLADPKIRAGVDALGKLDEACVECATAPVIEKNNGLHHAFADAHRALHKTLRDAGLDADDLPHSDAYPQVGRAQPSNRGRRKKRRETLRIV